MSQKVETAVVVVGGSLVGLSTAVFLAYLKVPVVVVERHTGSALHPRAVGYMTRTMELLRSAGIPASSLPMSPLSKLLKGGPPRRISVESLAGNWREEQAWTHQKPPGAGPPGGPPSDAIPPSPEHGIAIAQDRLEPTLRARAIELGANLMLGYKVTEWSQNDEGVSVTAVGADGAETEVKASYLVACDGSGSRIRESLGIKRQGAGQLRQIHSVVFICPRIIPFLDRGYLQFQIEGREDGMEAFITTYGDERWLLGWEVKEDEPKPDEAKVYEMIRKATGLPDLAESDVNIITTGKWDICGLIADHFQSGRIFLAGDSAHALPPNRGGYGANTGIADGHNLAWKLAAVIKGQSHPALLDTYSAERVPTVRLRHDQLFMRDDYRRYAEGAEWPWKHEQDGGKMLDDVAIELGQVYVSASVRPSPQEEEEGAIPAARTPQEWAGRPGTRTPHVPLRRGRMELSSLDLFGKTWVLASTDDTWEHLVLGAASKVKVKFEHIGGKKRWDVSEVNEGDFEQAFGLQPRGCVLVRPDGVIAWRSVKSLKGRGQKELQYNFDLTMSKVAFAIRDPERD